MVGWIPADLRQELATMNHIVSIHTTHFTNGKEKLNKESEALVNYYNSVVSGGIFRFPVTEKEQEINLPHSSCVRFRERSTDKNSSRSICEKDKNSEYLKGSVSCGVFFVESNGASDPNTYTWTLTNINNLKAQILDAFSIWSYTASQNNASVSFTPVWYESTSSTVISQPYEPILHPSTDDGLWITSILGNLGYNSGDKFTDGHNYNWDLRNTNGTNWAYAAFVINNPSPAAQIFTDGAPSFAYKGGPFCNLLLRAGGWAISTFFRSFAHESGHIFNAFDEYSSSDPSNCTHSFNGVVNSNYQGSPCNGTLACLMINNTFFGTGSTRQWNLCSPTKSHIGWQNLAPAPAGVSPANYAFVNPGTINFSWNRNTTNNAINSIIRVADTLDNIMDCSVLGASTSAQIYLTQGIYKWKAINGTDLFDGGYAEVSSPVYYLYVGVTGIQQTENLPSVEIYPNPTSGFIALRGLLPGKNLIEIFDLPGQKVFSGEFTGNTNKEFMADISSLEKGIYLLCIENKAQRTISKLIVR